MHADKYSYDVTIETVDGTHLTVKVPAESEWEAIDRKYSRFSHLQPDRAKYSAVRSRVSHKPLRGGVL